MENEENKCNCGSDCNCGPNCKCGCKKTPKCGAHHCGGAVYGLGVIGAAIYFIAQATTFWLGVLGFLKAIVWPALLVYQALKSLHV